MLKRISGSVLTILLAILLWCPAVGYATTLLDELDKAILLWNKPRITEPQWDFLTEFDGFRIYIDKASFTSNYEDKEQSSEPSLYSGEAWVGAVANDKSTVAQMHIKFSQNNTEGMPKISVLYICIANLTANRIIITMPIEEVEESVYRHSGIEELLSEFIKYDRERHSDK